MEEKTAKIPIGLIFGLIALILIISLSSLFLKTNSVSEKNIIYGTIETATVPHISEVSGKINQIYAFPGQKVIAGEIIATIDDSDQKYKLDQLQFTLEEKKLALDDADPNSGGQATSNYKAAQSAYNSAAAEAQNAREAYTNAKTLFAEGAISQNELNSKELEYETTANAAAVALEQLNSINKDNSASIVNVQISKLENQITYENSVLENYTIYAACSGTVISTNYQSGDYINIGNSLFSISNDSEHYLNFYINKSDLDMFQFDKQFIVKTDDSNDVTYIATVKYIDTASLYNNTNSNDNILIKLLLPADCPLQQGQKAYIRIE